MPNQRSEYRKGQAKNRTRHDYRPHSATSTFIFLACAVFRIDRDSSDYVFGGSK